MKKYLYSILATAIVGLAFSGCTKEPDVIDDSAKTFKMSFDAQVVDLSTKATLTPNDGETAFAAAWEDGDTIELTANGEKFTATWEGSSFVAEVPSALLNKEVDLVATYPYEENSSELSWADEERTQSGSKFNSFYDFMSGSLSKVKLSQGAKLVIPMERETSILYFHLTSDQDVAIESATLTYGTEQITTTYFGLSSTDATLWFNIIPSKYSMNLEVKAEGGKTFSISSKGNELTYEDGKLYKISKKVEWEGGSNSTKGFVKVETAPSSWDGDYLIVYNNKYAMDRHSGNQNANTFATYVDISAHYDESTKSIAANAATEALVYTAAKTANGYSLYCVADKSYLGITVGTTSTGARLRWDTSYLEKRDDWVLGVNSIRNVGSETMYVRWNNNSGSYRFAAYAEGGQQEITLFKRTGSAPVSHSVNCESVDNGSISATPAQAIEGTTISLTASPVPGYQFVAWTVTNISTSELIEVAEDGTFTMPDSDVTVSASFEEVQTPVYSSLSDLIEAGTPTSEGSLVTVTLTDEEIAEIFVTSQGKRNGIFIQVGEKRIEVYSQNVPESWLVGGTVSGTLTECVWKDYKGTWELCPNDWSALNYAAPLEPCAAPVIAISDAGVATITCATVGASIYYSLGVSPANPTNESMLYEGDVTMEDGQTIKAIAYKDGMKMSEVVSNVYSNVKTGTIKFGTNNVRIDAASVTGDDDLGNTWTITTVGTTSFTTNTAYYQVGASKSPATSITFTTTLPNSVNVKSMSAKFGGFSGTTGTVDLKVGEAIIGTGSLNATTDVTVKSTSSATGTVITVTVTGIDKGVKVYSITYSY